MLTTTQASRVWEEVAQVYQYGRLIRGISPEAEQHNSLWLGADTLGIEVTSLVLAIRCGFGNIDPQHRPGGGSSAIEEALSYPLPPVGSKLVTIRLDKDAIGAMAVLALRAIGEGARIDKFLVSWIGAQDRHGYRDAAELHPEWACYFRSRRETTALNVIARSNRYSSLEAKVRETARVLCEDMSEVELDALAAFRLRKQSSAIKPTMWGKVALFTARGDADRVRDWANGHYPVAVILDYGPPHEKRGTKTWTVIRRPGSFDRWNFEREINRAEAGARKMTLAELELHDLCWGGNQNIVSSPHGDGRFSALSRKTVLSIVERHLESGVVS